jgi:hypothetical protein
MVLIISASDRGTHGEFPFLGFLFDLLHCLFIDYGQVTQGIDQDEPSGIEASGHDLIIRF